MIGRQAELGELLAQLTEAERGRGQAALLLGEPGMGKSTLADAFVETAAEQGAVVARGWCSSAEMLPYWPWRTALDGLERAHPLASVDLPSLESYATTVLFDAVAATLGEAATRDAPLLVVIEDLHWADPLTLGLFHAVAERCRGMPVMSLATARDAPAEMSTAVAAALRDLPTSVVRVLLHGLIRPEVEMLLEDVLHEAPEAALIDDVCRRTGGNPFFAREVARLVKAQGPGWHAVPPGVQEVLQRRTARLGQPCHRLLDVAALTVGPVDQVDLPLLAEIADMPVSAAADILDEAVRARLLMVDADGRLRFAHTLVCEVIAAEIPPARRGALHARIAEVLASRGGEEQAATIADHWRRAIDQRASREAGRWSLVAARAAVLRLGFEQAIQHYERALDAPGTDRLTVLLELGEARRLAGDAATARATLLEATALARSSAQPEALARAALGLGGGVTGFEVPVWDTTQTALLREAVDTLPIEDSALRAAVLARLSLALVAEGPATLSDRIAIAERAVAMAERVGDAQALVASLAAYCDAVAGPDWVADRRVAAERMRSIAERAGDRTGILLARRLRVVALLEQGELALADVEIAGYERDLRGLDVPLFSWLPHMWRGMQTVLARDVTAAHRHATEIDALASRGGSENAAMMGFAVRMHAHLLDGNAADLIPAIRAISGQPWAAPAAVAFYFYAAGDRAGSAAELARTKTWPLPFDGEWLATMWWHGRTAIELGDLEHAAVAYDALRPYAEVWAVDGMGAGVCGVSAHLLGRLATMLGNHDEAARWLEQALAAHRRAGADGLIAETERAVAELSIARKATAPAVDAAPEQATLLRDGPVWRVSFRGVEATLPDSKGLRDLAVLLASPGREIHVLDLVDPTGTASVSAPSAAGEVLDAQARTTYKRRLAEIATELVEAEAATDLGRADRLRTEQEFLTAELAGALGLGGRARTAADPVERARKAVTMRIRTALRTIDEAHPGLARHLRLAVSTGRFCAYRPERSIRWDVTA